MASSRRSSRAIMWAPESAFGNIAVIAPQLLLGAQLHAVVGELALAALAVLARTIFAAVDGALRAAPDVLPHTAVDLVFRLVALGHRVLLCLFEDRALLCPGPPEPTGLGRSGGQDRGSRNAAQAERPAWRRVSRGKAAASQTTSFAGSSASATRGGLTRSPDRRRFRRTRETASATSASRPACADRWR